MEKRITVDMIYQKDFKVKARGYDQQEVDAFLDEIMEEMERQNKTIDELQAQLKEARQTVPAFLERKQPAPAPQPQQDGSSIQEVLAMAVKLKNDTMQEAQAKADAILAEAEQKANERLGGLTEEHERLTKQVAMLKEAAADYKQRFESLLQAQKELLDKSSDLF